MSAKLVLCQDTSIKLEKLVLSADQEHLHIRQLIKLLKLDLDKALLLVLEVILSMEPILSMFWKNLLSILKLKVLL